MGMVFNSGVYGGYGIQMFRAEGFNHSIDIYNQRRETTLTKKMDEFGTATGFKVGANIFQFLVDDILMGMRVSYQWMKEKNEATANLTNGTARREYDLTLKTFGIGMFFSYYASRRWDIKFLDATLTWNNADLVNRLIEPAQTTEQKLSNPESVIGFSLAGGITFYPLPPYISLEGSVGYSFFSIEEMEFEDTGGKLQVDEGTATPMTNFIDGGGLFAFIQLNISVPLGE